MIVCVVEPLPKDYTQKIKKRKHLEHEIHKLVKRGVKVFKQFWEDSVMYEYDDGRRDIY